LVYNPLRNPTNPICGVNIMTHQDRGHYGKKHPPDRKVNPKVGEAIKEQASKGEIPCAVAFTIAVDLRTEPAEVGFTADLLEIPIVKCQLGLFGYGPKKKMVKPAETISPALRSAIRDSLVGERLSCTGAWEIAERLGIGKMEVSSACEALNIKIFSCQLGAF
jgi:hypothetical protein